MRPSCRADLVQLIDDSGADMTTVLKTIKCSENNSREGFTARRTSQQNQTLATIQLNVSFFLVLQKKLPKRISPQSLL